MKKWYFVWYNGAYIAQYRSVRACINFIERKRFRNSPTIVDNIGDEYHLSFGTKLDPNRYI